MYYDIIEIEYFEKYKLHLRFKNGKNGVIDLENTIKKGGVFSGLKKIEYFKKVSLDPEWHCLCWPNGVDLDPESVYYEVTGEDGENFKKILKKSAV
jgi:hypothetical protein